MDRTVQASTSANKELYRQVLGRFPTGVVIITAQTDDGELLGLTIGSFTSVSMQPPLVAFLPMRTSSSWPRIAEVGRFCVNVLGDDQESLCRAFAQTGSNKFEGVPWRPAASGAPILDGVVAWMDCDIDSVADAGDHVMVIGRVNDMATGKPSFPLLFVGGAYGRVTPLSFTAWDHHLLSHLRMADVARPEMERVAELIDSECSAQMVIGDRLVTLASAPAPGQGDFDTRVGERLPLVPTIGTLFVAWNDADEITRWLRRVDLSAQLEIEVRQRITRVRERGFTCGRGREVHAQLSTFFRESTADVVTTPRAEYRDLVSRLVDSADPEDLASSAQDIRSVGVPVFHGSQVAMSLNAVALPRLRDEDQLMDVVRALQDAASVVSRWIEENASPLLDQGAAQ